jgi:hypothetical protein
MPDGKIIRQSFGEQVTLNEVCDFVAIALNFSAESSRLIQVGFGLDEFLLCYFCY